jgi:hypothetical protein
LPIAAAAVLASRAGPAQVLDCDGGREPQEFGRFA